MNEWLKGLWLHLLNQQMLIQADKYIVKKITQFGISGLVFVFSSSAWWPAELTS